MENREVNPTPCVQCVSVICRTCYDSLLHKKCPYCRTAYPVIESEYERLRRELFQVASQMVNVSRHRIKHFHSELQRRHTYHRQELAIHDARVQNHVNEHVILMQAIVAFNDVALTSSYDEQLANYLTQMNDAREHLIRTYNQNTKQRLQSYINQLHAEQMQ